jgi:hypothetical protein
MKHGVRFLFFAFLALLWGCSPSSITVMQRPDGSLASIVTDPDKIFPVFAKNLKIQLEAVAKQQPNAIEASAKLGIQREVIAFFHQLGDLTYQVRAVVILRYLSYQSAELETDLQVRERARTEWNIFTRSINDMMYGVQQAQSKLRDGIATKSKDLVTEGTTILEALDIQNKVGKEITDLVRELPGLEFLDQEGDCSGDSGVEIDRAGDRFYTTGPNLLSQGSTPCLDRVNTCQTRRRASSTSRTSQCLNEWRTAVTTTTPPAHDVAILPIATHPGSAPYTTWAIYPPDVRLTFW